jgi:hypothetical protein
MTAASAAAWPQPILTRGMNNEYLVWLLILGLAVAGWVLWLVQGRLPRDEADVLADEQAVEAEWISHQLAVQGEPLAPARIELVLEAHRQYLAGPPADLTESGPEAASTAPTAPALPPEGAPRSGRHATPVQRHDARREAPEADVGQAG